jgi:hypothetical protein
VVVWRGSFVAWTRTDNISRTRDDRQALGPSTSSETPGHCRIAATPSPNTQHRQTPTHHHIFVDSRFCPASSETSSQRQPHRRTPAPTVAASANMPSATGQSWEKYQKNFADDEVEEKKITPLTDE